MTINSDLRFGEAPPGAVAPQAIHGEAAPGPSDKLRYGDKLKKSKEAPQRSDDDWAHILAWVGKVDEVAAQAEATWGIDRLPRLVPHDLAAKFYSQAFKYNEALRTGSRADVEWEAQRMIKGWEALDAQSNKDGHWKYGDGLGTHDIWEVEALDQDKAKVAVSLVRTREEAKILLGALAKMTPARNTQVWTLAEVGELISGFPDLVKTKVVFPGAEVTNVRAKPPVDWTAGDSLPEYLGGQPVTLAPLGD